MIRDAGAALSGLFTAFVVIYLIEMLGHTIYPPPAGLDVADPDVMTPYVASLPIAALLFPMFAYFIGTFAGTFIACLIGTARPVIFATIVGMLVLAGTIANLIYIPHPLWFSIIAVVGILGSAWLAMLLGRKTGGVRTGL